MGNVWFLAALWVGLALIATLGAIWFRVSTALSEIVVGTAAQFVIGLIVGPTALGSSSAWVTFVAGTGAIVLTFLAGAELDPVIFRTIALAIGLLAAPIGAVARVRRKCGASVSFMWGSITSLPLLLPSGRV